MHVFVEGEVIVVCKQFTSKSWLYQRSLMCQVGDGRGRPRIHDSTNMGCLMLTRNCYSYRKHSVPSQSIHSSGTHTHNKHIKNKHTI